MQNSSRLLLPILGIVLSCSAHAQTWQWVGDGTANAVTSSTNWSPSGTLTLTSSTELVFGQSGSYSPLPFLSSGNYQIGTLTLTRTTSGSIFSGNGTGSFSGGLINGLNIATAINFNTNATAITTSTTGPIYLGLGVTIGGTAASSDTLMLGSPKGGGSNGILSSAGAVTKSGAFQLLISGDASSLGRIDIASGGGSVFLSSTATGFQSNVTTSSGTTFGIHPNTNATYTYSGVISGGGGFTMNGNNAGSTTVLNNQNTYTGQTRIMTGTLTLGVDNTLPASAFIAISPGGKLNVAGDQTINNFSGTPDSSSLITLQNGKTLTIKPVTSGFTQTTFPGTISGTGLLAIDGTGTLLTGGSKVKLTGNNSWGGASINGGSLELIGSNTGSLTINHGGALLGDRGSITGSLTVNSGGIFASVTHFTAGTTLFDTGSMYFWGLADPTTGSGTGSGTLTVNGTLALSSGLTLKLASFSTGGSNPVVGQAANFDPTQNYSFTLASTTGITGYDPSDFTFDFTDFQNPYTGTWSVATSLDGNSLLLNYTGAAAIPEPSTSAIIAGLAAGLLVLKRRKARNPQASS